MEEDKGRGQQPSKILKQLHSFGCHIGRIPLDEYEEVGLFKWEFKKDLLLQKLKSV